MTTLPTQLPVPSESPRDLKFNAGKIDEYVTSMGWTYTDRFGVKHYTIEGINYLAQQAMNAFGYITLEGVTFTTGATVNTPNEVLLNTADSQYYKWTGSYASGPKVVPANSTPASSGGVGPGLWLAVGDASVKAYVDAFIAALGSTEGGKGDALVAVKSVLANSAARTQHDKNADYVTLTDFVGVWDGVADDTANFQNAINSLASDPTKNSKCLFIPDTVKILVTSNVTLPMDIRITGSITPGYAHNGVAGNLTQKGCTILLQGGASIIMSGNTEIDRMHIIRAGMTGTESDSTSYSGKAIQMTVNNHSNMRVINSYVIGFNTGVYAVATILGKIIIDNTGFDCINGVEIGPTGDAPEIRYCMFWPYGTIAAGVNTGLYRSGNAMYFHDCAWPSVERVGVYGYERGIKAVDVTNFNATEFSFEAVGSGTSKYGGFTGIDLSGNCVTPRIVNCTFKHTGGYHIRSNMTDGCILTVDNCQFTDYDTAAIALELGSAIITNISTIGNTTIGVLVGANVRTCTIDNFYSSQDSQSIQVNNTNTVIGHVYKQESSGNRAYLNTVVQNPVTATTGTSLDVRTHLNFYTVSGTATITNIAETYIGHVITLMCVNTVTFNNGTSGQGQVRAAGSSQAVTGNQVIQFVCVGTSGSSTWRQLSLPVSF